MDEIWKPIPDTDYAISNTGKVASMKKGWREMKPGLGKNGYLHVTLTTTTGNGKTVYVHRLVANAFLPPAEFPEPHTNHKDGDRRNNVPDNLEWVTRSGNAQHSLYVLGNKNKMPRGEASWKAKLTEENVRDIRSKCASGVTLKDMAAFYGVSRPAVSVIVSRKSWAWLE